MIDARCARQNVVNPVNFCSPTAPEGHASTPTQRAEEAVGSLTSRASRPMLTCSKRLEVDRLLRECLAAEATPPPLRNIGEQLGLRRSSLRYWFPDLCDEISGRRALDRQRNAATERARRSSLVTVAIESMVAQGIYPTRRKVDAMMRHHGLALARPEIYQAYARALNPSQK